MRLVKDFLGQFVNRGRRRHFLYRRLSPFNVKLMSLQTVLLITFIASRERDGTCKSSDETLFRLVYNYTSLHSKITLHDEF
jgi:hypothetical protein